MIKSSYRLTDLNYCNKFLVQNTLNGRTFELYSDFNDFYHYYKKLEIKSYFEVITKNQKLYFDIDISDEKVNDLKVKDDLIKSIYLYFNEKLNIKLTEKDILIFTSHSNDVKKYKKSYHIIIDNYYVKSNLENKKICNDIIQNIECVDKNVYKSVQQFRLLHSSKMGANRPKIYTSNLYEGINLFYRSLISEVRHCDLIDIKLEEKPKFSLEKVDFELEEVINIIGKTYNLDNFKLIKSDNNILAFKLLDSYHCNLCNRDHENENPYVIILGIQKNIYFCCRRKEKLEYLGSLGFSKEIINNLNITYKEVKDEKYFNLFNEIEKKDEISIDFSKVKDSPQYNIITDKEKRYINLLKKYF